MHAQTSSNYQNVYTYLDQTEKTLTIKHVTVDLKQKLLWCARAIRVYIVMYGTFFLGKQLLPCIPAYRAPRSRKFGETELSQKATASSSGYAWRHSFPSFAWFNLFVSTPSRQQTETCNHRCHAATRFSRRLIVAPHMDCPDSLESWTTVVHQG